METISSSITSNKLGLDGRSINIYVLHNQAMSCDTFSLSGQSNNQMTCRMGHTQPLFSGPHLPNPAKISRLRPICATKGASGSDFGDGFGLVDENMIVLRKRIHELEVAERNYEAPSHWMEWERRYYTMYGSDVSGFVGLIQRFLLKTRPGLGIGLVVLTATSVPTSAVFICLHLMAAVRSGILGG